MFLHRILNYAQPFLITNRKYIILRNFTHSIFLIESQYELCPKLGDTEYTYLHVTKLDLGFHSKWVMQNYYQISCGAFSKRNITKLAHYISHTPNLKLYLKFIHLAWREKHFTTIFNFKVENYAISQNSSLFRTNQNLSG